MELQSPGSTEGVTPGAFVALTHASEADDIFISRVPADFGIRVQHPRDAQHEHRQLDDEYQHQYENAKVNSNANAHYSNHHGLQLLNRNVDISHFAANALSSGAELITANQHRSQTAHLQNYSINSTASAYPPHPYTLTPESLSPYSGYNCLASDASAAMSLSYESRMPMSDTQYSMQMGHDPQDQQVEFKADVEAPRYPSPPLPAEDHPYANYNVTEDGDAHQQMDLQELQKDQSEAPSPRSKPIPKPDREVTKDHNGRFVCLWETCTEEVRNFGRKCEWR